MVVVSSEGADGSEGDVGAGGADGSVMLHTEEDSLHEVWELFASDFPVTKQILSLAIIGTESW